MQYTEKYLLDKIEKLEATVNRVREILVKMEEYPEAGLINREMSRYLRYALDGEK